MGFPVGEHMVPIIELRHAKCSLVRVHDGSSLAELYKTDNPVKCIVNNDSRCTPTDHCTEARHCH